MSKAQAAYLDNVSRYSEGSRRSAQIILKLVFELVRPESVVDVGCSMGTWLAAAEAMGVVDYLGLDGDYVDRNALLIPRDRFVAKDLSRPFDLERKFDLVMSLEVAEHLPQESARPFVGSLVALGSVVLFSAAIPFQGGTGHVNEQWPDYWAALFSAHDYVPVDCIRPRVWGDSLVQVWYAQNTLLFVSRHALETSPVLQKASERYAGRPLNIVHPNMYVGAADPRNWDPRQLSVGQCASGARFQLKRKLRSSLHWRLQRLLWN